MSASKVQIVGGAFQDPEGNVLANGSLTLQLNQDCQIPSTGQVAGGIAIKVPLDANGNVQGTSSGSAIMVWPNDVLNPATSYYVVYAYDSRQQLAWGPFYGQILSTPSPFNLDAWVPADTGGSVPSSALLIQVDGVNAQSQNIENFTSDDDSVTIVDKGEGQIDFSAGGGASFKVAGVAVSDQKNINFESTDGSVSISNPSAGNINFTASSAGFASGSFLWSYQTLTTFGGTFTSAAPGPNTSTNNAVMAIYLEITTPVTINHISTIMASLNGGVIGFAIYDKTGNTKILDAGTNAFNGGSIGVQTINLGSPFTLQKGQYWVASAASVANNSLAMGWQLGGASYSNVVNTRVASAANSMSGGAMPATLGTLTPISNASVPGFLLNG